MATNAATTIHQGPIHVPVTLAGLLGGLLLAGSALLAVQMGSGTLPADPSDAERAQAIQAHRAGERGTGLSSNPGDDDFADFRAAERQVAQPIRPAGEGFLEQRRGERSGR